MKETKYINVVSGKGGTGKTLLCTILAELLGNQNVHVLVVDMDIFVRGLTALLYFHKGESLQLTDSDEASVSDVFYQHSREFNLAFHKYRSFDVCPAVSRINQVFNYEKEMVFDYEQNSKCFQRIKNSIARRNYDYVFFDCRAGYDSLISVVHEHSDVTICVQEEDDISEVTANNLIQQLEKDSPRKLLFRLVNKSRNIKTHEDLDKKQGRGLTFLGHIPFDMDVMNSFGERTFWDDISKSLYKSAAADSWNKLALKVGFRHTLNFRRYSPLISERFETSFSYLTSLDRLFALMGLMLTIFGLTYTILGEDFLFHMKKNPDKLISFIITMFGGMLFISSFIRRRSKKNSQ